MISLPLDAERAFYYRGIVDGGVEVRKMQNMEKEKKVAKCFA